MYPPKLWLSRASSFWKRSPTTLAVAEADAGLAPNVSPGNDHHDEPNQVSPVVSGHGKGGCTYAGLGGGCG